MVLLAQSGADELKKGQPARNSSWRLLFEAGMAEAVDCRELVAKESLRPHVGFLIKQR
jgi:hypothetical protein